MNSSATLTRWVSVTRKSLTVPAGFFDRVSTLMVRNAPESFDPMIAIPSLSAVDRSSGVAQSAWSYCLLRFRRVPAMLAELSRFSTVARKPMTSPASSAGS
jgi:hypothetical protein